MDATSISTGPAAGSQHNRASSPRVINLTSEDSSEKESNTSGQDNPPLTAMALTTVKGRNGRFMTLLWQSHSPIQAAVVCLFAA